MKGHSLSVIDGMASYFCLLVGVSGFAGVVWLRVKRGRWPSSLLLWCAALNLALFLISRFH